MRGVILAVLCFQYSGCCLGAEKVLLRKHLTTAESRCFRQLLQNEHSSYPLHSEIPRLLMETAAAKVGLEGSGHKEFVFLVRDPSYCGSAGCWMLIAERRRDGRCRLLDDGSGSGDVVTLLDRRDHGYRRLLTPCEIYFDGKLYQQIHEECPTAQVHR